MTDDGPIKVFVCSYEGGSPYDLTIPVAVLRRADAAIAAERERRRQEAVEAAEAAKAAARPQGWARLRAIFRRRQ